MSVPAFHPPHISSLPAHDGLFFEQTPESLSRLARAGYDAIGIACVLVNTAGEVLVADHKASAKLVDHTLGITSETLGGFRRGGVTYAEPMIQSIGRCISREVGLDLTESVITLSRDASWEFSDWPIGNIEATGKLLGVNVGLLLDDVTAEAAAQTQENEEVYQTFFVDPDLIIEERLGPIRPGTSTCLRTLGRAGLLDPANLSTARLVVPPLIEPDCDIDLRTLR